MVLGISGMAFLQAGCPFCNIIDDVEALRESHSTSGVPEGVLMDLYRPKMGHHHFTAGDGSHHPPA